MVFWCLAVKVPQGGPKDSFRHPQIANLKQKEVKITDWGGKPKVVPPLP